MSTARASCSRRPARGSSRPSPAARARAWARFGCGLPARDLRPADGRRRRAGRLAARGRVRAQRLVRVRPVTGRVTPVATFTKPWGVARAPSGSIFVSDQGSLERIDGNHAPTTVFAAEPGARGRPGRGRPERRRLLRHGVRPVSPAAGTARDAGAPGAGTAFSSPHGLTIASDGAVLVPDTNNNRILRVDPATGAVTPFAGLGHPRGIDVAADGSVFVAAADEGRVVHLSAAGSRIAAVGPLFGDPYALALGRDGSVYAIDAGPRRSGPPYPAGLAAGDCCATTRRSPRSARC